MWITPRSRGGHHHERAPARSLRTRTRAFVVHRARQENLVDCHGAEVRGVSQNGASGPASGDSPACSDRHAFNDGSSSMNCRNSPTEQPSYSWGREYFLNAAMMVVRERGGGLFPSSRGGSACVSCASRPRVARPVECLSVVSELAHGPCDEPARERLGQLAAVWCSFVERPLSASPQSVNAPNIVAPASLDRGREHCNSGVDLLRSARSRDSPRLASRGCA